MSEILKKREFIAMNVPQVKNKDESEFQITAE